MATKRKGTLVVAKEWWKHLRPFGKRNTAKRERLASKREIKKDIKDE
jgi:hypothetical protein